MNTKLYILGFKKLLTPKNENEVQYTYFCTNSYFCGKFHCFMSIINTIKSDARFSIDGRSIDKMHLEQSSDPNIK
jgi:hypothetical protein